MTHIGVAMLGYRFMGNAHSRALRAVGALGAALEPKLVSVSGRNAEALEETRSRLGWAEATTEIYTLSLHDALPISRPLRVA